MAAFATVLVCIYGFVAEVVANEKVREFYMYRGTKDVKDNKYVQQNVDLADLVGALKYIHSEAIAEHTLDPDRKLRKYDITVIARWRVLVNNPGVVTDMNQPPMVHADFGPFVTFDYGQATNNVDELLRLGDFVGVQEQRSLSWEYPNPYYWFSLSGFCPNLPYVCTNGWVDPKGKEQCEHEPPVHTALCPPNDPCPSKGTMDYPNVEPSRRRRAELEPTVNPKYCQEQQGRGKVLMGGLCGSTGETSDLKLQEPQGSPSCAYSYTDEELKQVDIDKVVGIKKEMCTCTKLAGECQCKDWIDFRTNCITSAYKKKFDNTDPKNPKVIDVPYCVEYDIHPFCAASCSSGECLAIPLEERELGLPFWKGRCNGLANQKRAESFAHGFDIKGAQDAHKVLAPATSKYENRVCDRFDLGGTKQCRPNYAFGGAFCTREWGGVCTSCWIPGTLNKFPDDVLPICPLSITKLPDYKDTAKSDCYMGNCCKTRDPSGKCCLYFDSCNTKIADVKGKVDSLDLTEDNMNLVEATQDTEVILKFIKRIAAEWGQASKEAIAAKESELRDVAYWSWGIGLSRSESLEAARQSIKGLGLGPTTTTTTTTTTVTAAASSGGIPAVVWVILVIAVLGAGAYFFLRPKPARAPPLIGNVRESELNRH